MLAAGKAAPAHNMQAERIMAMCDSQARRMPNITPQYVDTRVKSRSNNTVRWLKGIPEEKRISAISFARGREGMNRLTKEKEREKVQTEIAKRMKVKAQKKDEATRRTGLGLTLTLKKS